MIAQELLTALSDVKSYAKMKQPLDAMLSRQPKNPEIRALHEAYAKQMHSGEAPR